MSDHTTALVPIESWCYSSPDAVDAGHSVDVGLFAEALLYYERVMITVSSQPQLAEFIAWFGTQGRFSDLIALIRDGTIGVYDYAFTTSAAKRDADGHYLLLNFQDPHQAEPASFESRVLYHPSIEAVVPHKGRRKQLYAALRDRVTEVKAAAFGSAIENARVDFRDPQRSALVVQAFVDELWRLRGLGRSPEIRATVEPSRAGAVHNITWNVDFAKLSELAGIRLNFHDATPLTAGALATRFLWSAAESSCDLFLGQPMAVLVGDKLYESTERVAKAGEIVERLKDDVEFPDVRGLVNQGRLSLDDILTFRSKAKRFRRWLQTEADRDRNALVAYHNEVAKELGAVRVGRRALSLFGIVGPPLVSLYALPTVGPVGAALTGAGTKYLIDLVAKLGAGWTPVVFGNWLRDRIAKVIKGE